MYFRLGFHPQTPPWIHWMFGNDTLFNWLLSQERVTANHAVNDYRVSNNNSKTPSRTIFVLPKKKKPPRQHPLT